jgi:hypothetical protein
MTNLDYSNMFRLILSHHQANIRMKQSGCFSTEFCNKLNIDITQRDGFHQKYKTLTRQK